MESGKNKEGCSFCKALLNGDNITWEMRSTYADDNICDKINGTDCNLCSGCNANFSLSAYVSKEEVQVNIEFEQHIGMASEEEAVIHPLSETTVFNYCPICGKRLSTKTPKLEMSSCFKVN